MRRLPDDKFRGRKMGGSPSTHRLFLGIYPPEEYLTYIRDVMRYYDKQKRNLRPVNLDQVHLTLKFLGAQVSENSLSILTDEFLKNQGNYPKPEIKVNKVQFGFQHQDNPRAVLASVEDSDSLIELSDVVHDIVRDLRLRDTVRWKEHNAENFHITMARLKDAATRSTGKEVIKITQDVHVPSPEPFTAEYMDLIESKFSKTQGLIYKVLAKIKL